MNLNINYGLSQLPVKQQAKQMNCTSFSKRPSGFECFGEVGFGDLGFGEVQPTHFGQVGFGDLGFGEEQLMAFGEVGFDVVGFR